LVSATSVVFGLDWTAAPLPPMPETEASVQAAKLAARFPQPVVRMAKVEPKAPPTVAAQPQQRRAQQQVAVANPAAAAVRNIAPTPTILSPEQTALQSDAGAQPKCDIAACSAAYRSFRAEDCSWQPYEGPRRFCDKGNSPADVAAGAGTGDVTASIGGDQSNVSNKCDIAACKRAYFTFDPTDCTYRPSHGPRRLCEKGTPPKQDTTAKQDATASAAPASDDTAAKPDGTAAEPPKCNVEACRQAYFTFTAEDCTYQPSNGPRRLCTR
jgi:hypothetical protein